jgi:hypothetical protein
MANLFAQEEALAFGETEDEVKREGTPDWSALHEQELCSILELEHIKAAAGSNVQLPTISLCAYASRRKDRERGEVR